MKVIVFGATGMVGQGALRECLADPQVESILIVGRSSSGVDNPKVREIVQPDLFDYSTLEGELIGFDACFFCLGVSAAGMSEEAYHKVSVDLTLAA
ncbi:MAG: epimerase, partial [Thermoanaerobaculia bacterium]